MGNANRSRDPSPQLQYMLPGKLYLGSVPSDVNHAAAAEKSFVGCIGDATLNRVKINFNEVAEGLATIGRCSGPNQLIGSPSSK